MQKSRLWTLFIVAVGLLIYPLGYSEATGTILSSNEQIYCDQVKFDLTLANHNQIDFHVKDDTKTVISNVVTVTHPGIPDLSTPVTSPVVIPLNAPVTAGTNLTVEWSLGGGTFFAFFNGGCSNPVVIVNPTTPVTTTETTTTPIIPSGSSGPSAPRGPVRYDFGDRDSRYSMFVFQEGEYRNNNLITIYEINADSSGLFTYYVQQNFLEQMFSTPPTETTLIYASPDGEFQFFVMPGGGAYQINVGPNDQGEVFVFGFKAFPISNVYRSSFKLSSTLIPRMFGKLGF